MQKKNIGSREPSGTISKAAKAAIVVSALGYFVDIYDLVLFSIVRIASLKGLGITDEAALKDIGTMLLNWQMGGMLIGGIFWGVLGDKKGRLSVLFGSIFLYSGANIANGMINSVEMYAVLRFIAGIGLAGELGAGITLVSELMPKEKRGYGTMIVAAFGILGAVLAGLIGDKFNWRVAYYVGGGMGMALLILRIGVYESGMYDQIKEKGIRKGSFLALFTSWERFKRYVNCILIGLPLWFMVGILITFSYEWGKSAGAVETISPGYAILFTYAGLSVGDLLTGFLSQYFGTRKKVVLVCLFLNAAIFSLFFLSKGYDKVYFYSLCVVLGLINGYWAVFVTIAAEQFGTNLRATVATTVPNFVRGSVPLLTTIFWSLAKAIEGENGKPFSGMMVAGFITASLTLVLAFFAVRKLEESHGKDLDYIETI